MIDLEKYDKLCWKMAHKYSGKFEAEELYQVGWVGLLKAQANFDKSKGNKFITYAYLYIEGTIQNFINKYSNNFTASHHEGALINMKKDVMEEYEKWGITRERALEIIKFRKSKVHYLDQYSTEDRDITFHSALGKNEDYSSIVINDFRDWLQCPITKQVLQLRLQGEENLTGARKLNISRVTYSNHVAALKILYREYLEPKMIFDVDMMGKDLAENYKISRNLTGILQRNLRGKHEQSCYKSTD